MSVLTRDAPGNACEAGSFSGGISALAQGQLYALQHQIKLDGRVGAYPKSARGFSVVNSYLLKQPDAALLVDTGFGQDRAAIRTEIESQIAPGSPLGLFPLRLSEFMSTNNLEAFAGYFNIDTCYAGYTDAALWFDFGTTENGRSALAALNVVAPPAAGTIEVGKGRTIDVLVAPIRLLSTRWLYDRTTKTLFSSDFFTHVWRHRAEGPWVVTEANDTTTAGELRSFMLNTRYWWLEGALTDPLRRGIGDVFDKYPIETIAPSYGCVLRGSNVVARHYRMMDEFLKACDRSIMAPRYITRDEER